MSHAIPLTDPPSIEWIEYQRAEHVPRTPSRGECPSCAPAQRRNRHPRRRRDMVGGRRHLGAATRSNDLACLRAFYKWGTPLGAPRRRPTTRIDAPKVDKGLPLPSPAPTCADCSSPPDDLRRAVAPGAYAGLRVSEVAALHWHDVDIGPPRTRPPRQRRQVPACRPAPSSSTSYPRHRRQRRHRHQTGLERRHPATASQPRHPPPGIDATFHQLRHRYGTLQVSSDP